MSNKRENIILKGFAWFCIVIISLLIFNNTYYFHTHTLSDGSIITHAHPYHKSNTTVPGETHHHSKIEIFFLDSLRFVFIILFVPYIAIAVKRVFVQFKVVKKSILHSCLSIFQNRAPPVLF